MTSMRIDGDKSVRIWARRLGSLLDDMEKDGVTIESSSTAILSKDGEKKTVIINSGDTW